MVKTGPRPHERGNKDREVRQRTITVYLDKKDFQASLDIPNDDSIHWFVIDHATKKILMRGAGNISQREIHRLKTSSFEK